MRKTMKVAVALMVIPAVAFAQQFTLGKKGYFERGGINVMAFQDTYPEGHQSGVCVIMNGNRVATNGDLRLEATPGQWQPLPKQKKRTVGENEITTFLSYPDSTKHETGFNPMIYPDLQLSYSVKVEGVDGGVMVTVETLTDTPLKLFDGRMNHNNGWFVLRSEVPAGATKGAIKWLIKPAVTEDWFYKPVTLICASNHRPVRRTF